MVVRGTLSSMTIESTSMKRIGVVSQITGIHGSTS